MAIAASCPECSAKLKLPDAGYLKKTLKCPKCGEAMRPKPAAGGGSPKASAAKGGAAKARPKRPPRDPFDDLLEQDSRNPDMMAPLPPGGAGATPRRSKKRATKPTKSGGGGNAINIVGGIVALLLLGGIGYFALTSLGGGSLGGEGEGGAMAWLPAGSSMVATLRPPQLVSDDLPADARQQLEDALEEARNEMGIEDFSLEDVGFVAMSMPDATSPDRMVVTVVSEKLAEKMRLPQQDLTEKSIAGFQVWEENGGLEEMSIAVVGSDLLLFTSKGKMESLLTAGKSNATFDVDRSLPASVWADIKKIGASTGAPIPQGDDLQSRAAQKLSDVRVDVASVDYPVTVNVNANFNDPELAGEIANLAKMMGPVVLGGLGLVDRPGEIPSWITIAASGGALDVDLNIPEDVGKRLAETAAQQAGQFGGFGGPSFGPPGGGMGGPPSGFGGPPPGFGSSPSEGLEPPEGFGEPTDGGEPSGEDGSDGGGFFD